MHETPLARDLRYRAVWAGCAVAVIALDFWFIGIGAPAKRFAWNSGLDQFYGLSGGSSCCAAPERWADQPDAVYEYYALLGRAFASGHLSLPVKPSPALLALPNPLDEKKNRPYRLLDAVLYKQRFYLYHGAAPALVLFAPWYLVTRHDFPENFAAFLFCSGAYLFGAALFLRALASLPRRIPLALFALLLLALGLGQSAPVLLHQVKVYEVAIAAGAFFLSAGFYFLFLRFTASGRHVLWAAISGVCFGLAIGCRPHLGLAALCAFGCLLLLRSKFRDLAAFALPVALCCLAIAAYDFARFGNPFEFGLRYQLGDASYMNFHLSLRNLLPGLYYLLICPPDLVAEFPFFRLALRPPWGLDWSLLPQRYFLGLAGGALALSPLALGGLIVPFRRVRWSGPRALYLLLCAMLLFSAGCILFIASTGLISERFKVDFLPPLVLAASIAAAEAIGNLRGPLRAAAVICCAALCVYSIAANLSLGVQGPDDQFVQSRPRAYVHLARWFSPVARFRPLLNPTVRIRARFQFAEPCPSRREVLIATGEFGSRYLLSAECTADGHVRLISQSSVRYRKVYQREIQGAPGRENVAGVYFDGETRIMTVTWNGTVVMRHPLRFLVMAPSQIHYGWDPSPEIENPFEGTILAFPPVIAANRQAE